MVNRITIKEIARKADVSIGTVDRVLHNRGRVAEATRDKVLKIAKEGNYSSNVMARHLKLNKTYRISVILPEENNYWLMLKEGIEEGCAEFAQMGFTAGYCFVSNDGSQAMQLNQILDSNADGFIIAPSAFHQQADLLCKLREKGKPYVFVDSSIIDAGQLTFIGQDSYRSGVLGASLLHDKYLSDYEIYITTFSESDIKEQIIKNRIEGFRSYFDENEIKHANIHEVNLEKDQITADDFLNVLLKHENPVHLFIPNSKTYKLAEQLIQFKETNRLRVVGYDLLQSNLRLLNCGAIDYLIHQKPKMQGYLGMQSLYKNIVLKTDVPLHQFMPLDIINKENVMYCQ